MKLLDARKLHNGDEVLVVNRDDQGHIAGHALPGKVVATRTAAGAKLMLFDVLLGNSTFLRDVPHTDIL